LSQLEISVINGRYLQLRIKCESGLPYGWQNYRCEQSLMVHGKSKIKQKIKGSSKI